MCLQPSAHSVKVGHTAHPDLEGRGQFPHSMDRSQPPLTPEPWTPVWDEGYKEWFFWNSETGESTWERPGFGQPGPEGEVQPAHTSAGWLKVFDPEQDQFYYFNIETEESTWERPAEYASASPSPASGRARSPAVASGASTPLAGGGSATPTPPTSAPPSRPGSPRASAAATLGAEGGPGPMAHAGGDVEVGGHFFPHPDTLPPPPAFRRAPKVYPSVVASRGMLPPRFLVAGVDPNAFPPASEPPDPPAHSGYLLKKGVSNTQWKKRFFSLQGRARVVRYYKNESTGFPGKPQNAFAVYGAKIRLLSASPPPPSMLPWLPPDKQPKPPSKSDLENASKPHCVALLPPEGERVYHLAADSAPDMWTWLVAWLAAGAVIVDRKVTRVAEEGAAEMLAAVRGKG